MHVKFIMKIQSFYLSLCFSSIGEAIFPFGRRKVGWVKFENAQGNGFEKYSLGKQTFPLGRISLGLLHRGSLGIHS